jgi:diadenosine tetraphosphate (Ap4A) HIT family hydrolase
VYDEGPWFAFAAADVPGWIMLASKQHVDGMWSLSADQADKLGAAIRAVGRAVIEATGAHRAHMVYLGESGLHFHLGFFPRAADDPPLLSNAAMLEQASSGADPERARVVSDAIRTSLASS